MEEESSDSHSIRNMTWMIYFLSGLGGDCTVKEQPQPCLPENTRYINRFQSLMLSLWFFVITDDASLLPCPQTFLQAQADRGRFTLDEYCNPTADPYQCVLYHFGASHCFRANIPRYFAPRRDTVTKLFLNLRAFAFFYATTRGNLCLCIAK